MSASLYFVTEGNPDSVKISTELNLSNSSTSYFLASLGMEPNFNEAPNFPIGFFEEKLLQFISNHGPASPLHAERESQQDGNWIECGRRANYLIEKAWLSIRMVREAKTKGATHGYFS